MASSEQTPKARVLVVDDNEVNRDLLARRLSLQGYEVECAATGEDALVLARPDRFRVVLLDVMMPGISGLEVLERLRARHSSSELPVVMVTARDASPDVVRSLELGANDHITKPIDFAVLFARIATQLRLQELSRARNEFLRIASHDLKTPLAFLSLCAALLRKRAVEGVPCAARDLSMLEKMTVRCADMQRIIEDFLDSDACKEGSMSLRLAPVQLNEVVASAVENLGPLAAAKSIGLGHQLDASIAIVYGDAARLTQVLENLVANAIKFTSAGGAVTVHTFGGAGEVVCEVVDSGPGFCDEEVASLFQKYRRGAARATGGESSSGLGLYICRQIIELHGGRIGARNNAARAGATLWFGLAPAFSERPSGGVQS